MSSGATQKREEKSGKQDAARAAAEQSQLSGHSQALLGQTYAEQSSNLQPPSDFEAVQKRGLGSYPMASQVQMLRPGGESATSTDAGVREAASQGLAGGGGAMPHASTIQNAFGHHDIGGVSAHMDAPAQQASSAIGAEAYTVGESVAFNSAAPSLHTTAHEAAHVIQQRGGVSVPGGVGAAGDSYETHADQVADAVVSGQSAESLLDANPASGGLSDAAVQRVALQLRANEELAESTEMNQDFLQEACAQQGVSYSEVLAWINNKYPDTTSFVSVQEAVAALHGLDTRDPYFNNVLKVQFENELGQALNADRAVYEGILDGVLEFCLSYIQARCDRDGTDLKEAWGAMTAMHGGAEAWQKDLYYGRIADSIDEIVNGQDFYGNMQDLFSGQGSFSISQKCFGIQQFHNMVYEHDWTENKAGLLALMEDLNARAMDPSEVRWGLDASMGDTEATDIFGSNETGGMVAGEGDADAQTLLHKARDAKKVRRGRYRASGSHGTERTVRRGVGGRSDTTNRHTGPQAEGDQRQIHGRGIDVWTMDERQLFIQQARVLDMPLAGSVSGTTSDLITVAMLAGVTSAPDKFKFVCACLDHFIGAGAHTFHEVMTAAQPLGIAYTPGEYHSFFGSHVNAADFPTTHALLESTRAAGSPYKTVRGIGR